MRVNFIQNIVNILRGKFLYLQEIADKIKYCNLKNFSKILF